MSKSTVLALVIAAFIDKDSRKRYDPKGPHNVYEGAQERIDTLAAKGFVDPKAEIPKKPGASKPDPEADTTAAAEKRRAELKRLNRDKLEAEAKEAEVAGIAALNMEELIEAIIEAEAKAAAANKE